MIVGVILIISLPNRIHGGVDKMWYLFGMRILMGIGIGGDYPMSASIVAERSTLRNRGRMLGWIFSNQYVPPVLESKSRVIADRITEAG